MVDKITLADLGSTESVTSAAATVNANSAIIETAFNSTLSRDGTSPNTMEANLDMNSYRILNLPLPLSDLEPARLVDVRDGIVGPTGPPGTNGTNGTSATITVGSTTTLAAGSPATVVNVGTPLAATFNFGIPKGADGAGTGDFSSNTATSVDSEVVVFSGTTGKLGKRATGSGIAKLTAGVLSTAVASTDYIAATTGSAIQKASSGGLTAATAGTDFMHPGTTSLITVGYTITPYNGGTQSTGTYTPAAANGNYQYYTNNGAHTLAVPAADCGIDILITNGASAGTITFSGYTIASGNVGDSLTTTNTHKFIISIRRINSISTYTIKALQ